MANQNEPTETQTNQEREKILNPMQQARVTALKEARQLLIARGPLNASACDPTELADLAQYILDGSNPSDWSRAPITEPVTEPEYKSGWRVWIGDKWVPYEPSMVINVAGGTHLPGTIGAGEVEADLDYMSDDKDIMREHECGPHCVTTRNWMKDKDAGEDDYQTDDKDVEVKSDGRASYPQLSESAQLAVDQLKLIVKDDIQATIYDKIRAAELLLMYGR